MFCYGLNDKLPHRLKPLNFSFHAYDEMIIYRCRNSTNTSGTICRVIFKPIDYFSMPMKCDKLIINIVELIFNLLNTIID